MDTAVTTLIRERAKAFRHSFVETSREVFSDNESGRIFHSGEYGSYRERLLKHLLAAFIPNYLSLSEGFVIDRSGNRSTQADVIIYDAQETPKIEDDNLRRFFPIETITSVGEVKSSLTVNQLQAALRKLAIIKKMRHAAPEIVVPIKPASRVNEISILQMQFAASQQIRRKEQICLEQKASDLENEQLKYLRSLYDPVRHHWQGLVSFLVCAEIQFSAKMTLESLMAKIQIENAPERDIAARHNFLLSIRDGYQSYSVHPDRAVNYPLIFRPIGDDGATQFTGLRLVEPNADCDHIIAFVADLSASCADTAIYPFTSSGHFDIKAKFIPSGQLKYVG